MSVSRGLLSLFGLGGRSTPGATYVEPLLLPPELVWNAAKFTPSTEPYAGERSHFGGNPNLADGQAWPERDGRQLDFLFRLDCSDLVGLDTSVDLPPAGALLFFYDLHNQPWGQFSDVGGWAVLYQVDGAKTAPAAAAGSSLLPAAAARFEQIKTYPDPWSPWVAAADLTEDQQADLMESEAYNSAGQVGGHPSLIQNAMEIDCELASRGLDTDAKTYDSPEGKAAAAVAREWRLLLQLPSDERLGTIFADYGSLYYWIKADDLAKRDFSRVWMQMQTS